MHPSFSDSLSSNTFYQSTAFEFDKGSALTFDDCDWFQFASSAPAATGVNLSP